MQLPALQIVLPLFGAILAALVRRPAPAYAVTLAVSFLSAVIAWLILGEVLASGPISYVFGNWPAEIGIEYRIDTLNALLLALITSVAAMPMLIHKRRWWAARSAEPAGAARKATAIGSISNGSPDAIGRPGAAEPPHQMPKAPTVASNAAKIKVISSACRRSGPSDRHIRIKPVAASTYTGASARRPYS